MTKRLLTTALLTTALATVLGGCTVNHYNLHQPSSGGGTGDPAAPKVVVVNGNIGIDQDVLRFPAGQTNVRITWRLEGKGGRLTFPENGVVFERAADGEIVDCSRNKDYTEFSCTNRHSKPGVYRYGINANEDGKPLKPLDPYVMND